MSIELNPHELKVLNTLTRIEWKVNRSWVNRGKAIVVKHYDNLDTLSDKYPSLETVIMRLKSRVDTSKSKSVKSDTKITDTLFSMIWEQVIEDVKASSVKYGLHRVELLKAKAEIYREYESLTREEQREKYPRGYFNTKGAMATRDAYDIMLNQKSVDEYQSRQQTEYVKSESNKIKNLIHRVVEKLDGDIMNPVLHSHSATSMRIDVVVNNLPIEIQFEAILAGGYNIQRLHRRWLATFTVGTTKHIIKP